MTNKTISVSDLMAECNCSDLPKFRRLLRRNGFSISLKKPVSREEANQIVSTLVGQPIDWYKYAQKERDRGSEGPLKRKSIDSNGIQEWYQKVIGESGVIAADRDYLLGVAFSGGFLAGGDGSEFILKLAPGINVLIGDRGAGKSTMLTLLGLIADSISEETDVLITKLLNLLNASPEQVEVTRRVRQTLRQYGVKKYACFFVKDNVVLCFYVDINEGAYALFELVDGQWRAINEEEGSSRPKMQILQQGEVIRIAEERERYYLNNLLDSLYPDLYAKREDFARTISKLATQLKYYQTHDVELTLHRVTRFIEQRRRELHRISLDIARGTLSEDSVRLIEEYIQKIHSINANTLPKTILGLLKSDEEGLYQLYLGRIVPFLVRLLRKIKTLQQKQSIFLAAELARRVDYTQEIDDPETDIEMIEELSADKEALAEMENAEPLLTAFEYDEKIESRDSQHEIAALLEAEVNNPINRELVVSGRSVIDLLETRLRMLRSWRYIYSQPRLEWTSALGAFVKAYTQLLQQKIELISLQESKCRLITKVLNADEIEINIYTKDSENSVAALTQIITGLNSLGGVYEKLFSATPSSRLRDLTNAAKVCDNYTSYLRTGVITLKGIVESNEQNEFIFIPVSVTLRQGSIYRNFSQLSFGQKSGIILKMVLLSSNEGVAIIDQPEDNLDANSIVYMLAPTLNRLGNKRQVIIATHNSNLVLALDTDNVVVLESLGETGRVKTAGAPLRSKNLVREMLDILEGGVETFDLKIKTYEDFITRVRGEILDIDIQLIESSFRRRTIDNLRNLLQPVVSDRSILDFARHELKQPDHARIQADIKEMQRLIVESKGTIEGYDVQLVDHLDKLCSRLDSHIDRLMAAINDIRLMDTQAQPREIDIYSLLTELKSDYEERIGQKRAIKIELDELLKDQTVYADIDHLRLVFRNLINNSFRATEKRIIQNFKVDRHTIELIRIKRMSDGNNRLNLLFMDNGCGIEPEIKRRLYFERCSDQKGRDHGLGGVIIRKLLDLNGGVIQIIDTPERESDFVTIQQISLPTTKHKTRPSYA